MPVKQQAPPPPQQEPISQQEAPPSSETTNQDVTDHKVIPKVPEVTNRDSLEVVDPSAYERADKETTNAQQEETVDSSNQDEAYETVKEATISEVKQEVNATEDGEQRTAGKADSVAVRDEGDEPVLTSETGDQTIILQTGDQIKAPQIEMTEMDAVDSQVKLLFYVLKRRKYERKSIEILNFQTGFILRHELFSLINCRAKAKTRS